MKHMGIKLEIEKTNLKIQNVQEDPDVIEVKRKFKKLLHENKTVERMEVNIDLKPDAK